MPVLSPWFDAKKNGLWFLREGSSELVRSKDPSCSGPLVRGCPNLSGISDSACLLSALREGETGEALLSCRQSVLHEAICFLCGETMPVDDDPGCGEGDAFGLAHDQGVGEVVHAGATSEDGKSNARSDWH